MTEVFISYKSERRKAAEHLSEILRLSGYTVWFDYSLVKGTDFAAQIDRKIRQAKAVIVLWCTRSVSSEWVREEVDLASELGTLLPTKIEPCSLPIGNRMKDYVDLCDWDGSPRSHEIDSLLMAIADRVGRFPTQDFRGLITYEQQWRRFGKPTLRAFALDVAIEHTQDRTKLEASHVTLPEVIQLSVAPQLPVAAQENKGPLAIDAGIHIITGPATARARRHLIPGAGKTEWFRDFEQAPEMVVVPSGTFVMGSTDFVGGTIDCSGPQRTVQIRVPFALSRAPVTFAQWDFAVEHGLDAPPLFDEGWGRGDRPAINVSWIDAKAYTEWLREFSGHHYRLPSEAEWEFACRAGTTTKYWWGDEYAPDLVNCDGYNLGRDSKMTVSVYSLAANPYGLLQVHGNVWEWVEDHWHERYSRGPIDGSAWCDKINGHWRVMRGGAWTADADQIGSASRSFGVRESGYPWCGFRVARMLPAADQEFGVLATA